MQSDKAKLLFAVLVILIFIGSAIAYGVLAILESQKPKLEEPPPLVQTKKIIPGDYTADGIKLRIDKILNRYKIVANTAEEDILELDSALKAIGFNVYNSRYAEISGGKLTYIADLLPSSEIKLEDAYSKIQDLNLFEGIQLFKFATAELLDKNAMLHLNKDANIVYPISKLIKSSLIEAIVSPSTEEQDIIYATINATVAEQGFIVIAFEEKNETAQPKEHSLEQEFTISELEDKLFLTGIADYKYAEYFANLKQDIVKSEVIEDANVITSFSDAISIDINSGNFSEKDINDLKLELSTLANVKSADVDVLGGITTLTIKFNNGISSNEYKTLINEIKGILNKHLSIEQYTLHGATGSINIAVLLKDEELSNEAADYLLNILGERLQNLEIKQYGKISADKLSANSKDFIIEDGYFLAQLKPGHKKNEKVKLKLDFYTQRNKVIFVNATEIE
ncbi:MAG: hypothetical protein J7L14_00540 [Candidatus Diapherotrites archaeon]|nr:hypothetical protein [Candidatus Diapherotrites archaeon]